MRSLSASQRLLGTEDIVVVMHEAAASANASEDDFRQQLADDGVLPNWRLGAFSDLEATLHTRSSSPHRRELPHRDHIRARLRPRGSLREDRRAGDPA